MRRNTIIYSAKEVWDMTKDTNCGGVRGMGVGVAAR